MSPPTTILATLALLLRLCRDAGFDPFVAVQPEGGGRGFYTGLQWGSPLFHSLVSLFRPGDSGGSSLQVLSADTIR